MFTKASALAFFTAVASAQLHAPVGNPSGNPIAKPGLNELVPACTAYTITWEPTTPNTVSILLLRGPSENVVPLGAPIAQGIANSGTFSWTPGTELEADSSRYGIQLIDDVTGQYQYSTQFGIQKDACGEDTKSSATPSSAPSSTGGYGSGYPVPSETKEVSSTKESYPTSVVNSSSAYPSSVGTITQGHSASSGVPHNSTIVQPTKTPSVPASLKTTASETGSAPTGSTAAPSAPQSTGAASGLRAGLGLAGAVAGLVFML